MGSIAERSAGSTRGPGPTQRVRSVLIGLGLVVAAISGCGGADSADVSPQPAAQAPGPTPTRPPTPRPTPTKIPPPTPSPTATPIPAEDLWLKAAEELAVEWMNEFARIKADPAGSDPTRMDRMAAIDGARAHDGTDLIAFLIDENMYHDPTQTRYELIDDTAHYTTHQEYGPVIEVDVCAQDSGPWRYLDTAEFLDHHIHPDVYVVTVIFKPQPPLRVLHYIEHPNQNCTFTKPPDHPITEPTPIQFPKPGPARDQLLTDATTIAHTYYNEILLLVDDARTFDTATATALAAPGGPRDGVIEQRKQRFIERNYYLEHDGVNLGPIPDATRFHTFDGEQSILVEFCVETPGVWHDFDTGEVVFESNPLFIAEITVTPNRPLLVLDLHESTNLGCD